jgi:hypothetical protein
MRHATLATLAALALVTVSQAQAPKAPAPAPTASPSPSATDAAKDALKDILEKELAVQPGQYTYQPAGRRDPFISLLANVGPSEGVVKTRPPGMAGFLIQEVALKGIVKDQSGFIAMLAATDGKSYFAKVGQKFYDGEIIAMDVATVTFRQEVTDPLSPVKSRDLKKSLYSSEEARQ